MVPPYSSEIAKEMLRIINEKGWNAYKSHDLMEAEEIIRQNLAQSLELGGRYVLLPAVDDPKDPKEVFGALENIAQKLDRKMPTIKIGRDSYPLTGFTLMEYGVKIHTPEGLITYYDIFTRALNSLIQTK